MSDERIICMGNPGMGKTHLSIALGLLACNEGFRVRFYSAPVLASELVEAQESHLLIKLQKQLSKVDLLILDDLSYLSFSKRQSKLMFQVISDRSELASLIISTNLEFSKWVDFFGDPMLIAALVDRVTHRAHILNTNGDSYRLKESKARNIKVNHYSTSAGGSLFIIAWITFMLTFTSTLLDLSHGNNHPCS